MSSWEYDMFEMEMRTLESANAAGDFLFLFRLHFTHAANQKMLPQILYDWLEIVTADCSLSTEK